MLCRANAALRGSHLLLRRAMIGSALAGLAIHQTHTHLASAPPSDTSLGSLWAAAIDGMIGVPGSDALASPDGVLYMAPVVESSALPPLSVVWPKVFAKGVVFSLTASNPMGIEASVEQNRAANKRLEVRQHCVTQTPISLICGSLLQTPDTLAVSSRRRTLSGSRSRRPPSHVRGGGHSASMCTRAGER